MDVAAVAQEIRDTVASTPVAVERLLQIAVDIAKLRCSLWHELALRRAQYLYPQEKGKTELDRRTMLDASVADLERDYEFAKRLEVILDIKLGVAHDRN